MKSIIVLAAAAALVSTPVIAADNFQSPDSFNWSGTYVGAFVGYGWGKTHDIANPAADEKEPTGALGGISVGANWHLRNNFVLGIEADAAIANLEDEWIGADFNEYDAYYTNDEITALGTLRARLGYSLGRVLPYVTGGLAVARTEHMVGCDRALAPDAKGCSTKFEDSASDTSVGWTAGAGLELAISDRLSVKTEYLYTDLGTNEVTLTDPNYPALSGREFDTSFHAIRLGVNYRF